MMSTRMDELEREKKLSDEVKSLKMHTDELQKVIGIHILITRIT